MTTIPIEHIEDAHKLQADAEIYLYEITPAIGTGTIYFKADNTVTYRTKEYFGIPCEFTGNDKANTEGSVQPTLVIGDEQIDLLALKPLIFDGSLDGGNVVRIRILLDDLINNRLVIESQSFRIKQIGEYSRSKIILELGALADSLNFTLPTRRYYSPEFPTVVW
jgi:hypothetical protein